jgi:N-methylhydantoinase B
MPDGHDVSPGSDDRLIIEIARNGLEAITEEMAITHVRAAYSSVVRDMLDFSTAICDRHGKVVAQGLSLALQLGAVPRFMDFLSDAEPQDGDVFLTNHPWRGGVHLPDFFFAKPVMLAGDVEPSAWVVMVSHMVDVGGRFPGGVAAGAVSLWEEGLVIPHMRLVARGVLDQAVLDLIVANSREPTKVRGDVRAALAGLQTGASQLHELAERLGRDTLTRAMAQILDGSERATRAAIAELPDGTARAVDYLDDDGNGGEPVKFVCEVRKWDDHLCFDFTGTADQVPAGINTTIADVISVVAFVTRAAMPTVGEVNDGFYRCLDYVAPEGCIVNARYPAAVGARAASIYRLTDVAMVALGTLAPARLPANDGGPGVIYFSGRLPNGEDWIYLDYIHAGWGATARADGVPGVSHPIANAANIPVEVMEEEYPLRMVRYGIEPATAGSGRRRGAPSVVREYELLAPARVDFRLERMQYPPAGLRGGGAGSTSRLRIRQGGAWQDLAGKGTIALAAGDRVSVQLAAGGGYGEAGAADASVPA